MDAGFAVAVMALVLFLFGIVSGVGLGKFVDKTFRANKDQLRRAKDGKRAEAVRRARRDGTPEPELISVQQDGPASKGQGSPRK